MYCTVCGRPLNDSQKFCPACGSPNALLARAKSTSSAEPARTPEYPGAAPTPIKTKQWLVAWRKIAVLCAAVVLLAAAAYFTISILSDPARLFKNSVMSGDYEKAEDIYYDKMSGKSEEENDAETTLMNMLQEIRNDFISQTSTYEEANNRVEAIRGMGIIADSDIEETKTKIDELNSSRTAFSAAEAYLAAGEYKKAIEQYGLVIPDDGNFETAQAHMVKAAGQYRAGVLDQADKLIAGNSYDDAMEILKLGLEVLPSDQQLTQSLSSCQTQKTAYEKKESLTGAETYAASGDMAAALEVIQKALKNNTDDADLKNAANRYQKQIVDDTLEKAKEAFGENKDYAAAISALREGLSVLPNEAAFADAIKEYETYQPVELESLYCMTGEYRVADSVTDIYGNKIVGKCYSEGTATYYADAQYSKFTGKIVLPTEYYDTRLEVYLKIYGDGKLLYTSPPIGHGFSPLDFAVNIAGVSELKMDIGYDIRYLTTSDCPCVIDPTLFK